MKIKALFLLVLSGVFLPPLMAADTVNDIRQKHYRAMLSDLQSYMKENSGAEDLDEARGLAIESAYYLDDPVILDLLKDQFSALKSTKPLPVQELQQTGIMLTRFGAQHGSKEVSEFVLKEFKSLAEETKDPNFTQLAQMIEQEMNMPGIGDAPELSGVDVNGKDLTLKDFKGKVVLLDFWATWCPPCVAEVPNLIRLHEKYAEQGFEIIGISADRNKEVLTAFTDLKKMNWPQLYDNEQNDSIIEGFMVNKFPTTFLLDGAGKIIAVDLRGDALEKKLAALFDE